MLRLAMMALLTIICGCSAVHQHAQNLSLLRSVQMLNSSRLSGFSGYPTLDDCNASTDAFYSDTVFGAVQVQETAALDAWTFHIQVMFWVNRMRDHYIGLISDTSKDVQGFRFRFNFSELSLSDLARESAYWNRQLQYQIEDSQYSDWLDREEKEEREQWAFDLEIQEEELETLYDAAADALEGIKPQQNVVFDPTL
jgi:hypothetical protein